MTSRRNWNTVFSFWLFIMKRFRDQISFEMLTFVCVCEDWSENLFTEAEQTPPLNPPTCVALPTHTKPLPLPAYLQVFLQGSCVSLDHLRTLSLSLVKNNSSGGKPVECCGMIFTVRFVQTLVSWPRLLRVCEIVWTLNCTTPMNASLRFAAHPVASVVCKYSFESSVLTWKRNESSVQVHK